MIISRFFFRFFRSHKNEWKLNIQKVMFDIERRDKPAASSKRFIKYLFIYPVKMS